MADSIINDKRIYVSTPRESAYNTAIAVGASFTRIHGKAIPEMLPEAEQFTNEGDLGLAHTGPTKLCQYNWKEPTLSIAGEIDNFTSFMGRLMLRCAGGTIAITEPVSATVYLHTASPIAGHQLPGTSIVYSHDANSFLYAGCVVQRFKFMQEGLAQPTYEIDLIGTGKFTTPHGVTSLPTSEPSLDCVDPYNSQFIWTDSDSTTTDFGSSDRLMGFSFEYNNNCIVGDRRMGEGTSGVTNGTLRHRGQIKRGEPSVTASVKLAAVAADIDEWTRMSKRLAFTNGTFRVRGSIASGSTRFAHEAIIPTFYIGGSIPLSTNNKIVGYQINLVAMRNSTIGGYATMGTTNTTATAYV
jgi:hypothetical protein